MLGFIWLESSKNSWSVGVFVAGVGTSKVPVRVSSVTIYRHRDEFTTLCGRTRAQRPSGDAIDAPLHTLSSVLICVPSSIVWIVKSISGTGIFS